MKRRDFVKTVAMSGMAIAASDAIADLLAQSPRGKVLESRFKGLSDVALTEAKRLGCTYADIRFTRNTNAGVNASGGNRSAEEALAGGGGGGRGAGGGTAGGRGPVHRRWRGLGHRRGEGGGAARRAALHRRAHDVRGLGDDADLGDLGGGAQDDGA